MAESKIENISDTARWVALYRAIESERPDAHFQDSYARRLSGERGAAIAKAMPAFESGVWPMVVRTCVFDELILRAIGEGFDTVVNLAAGLDARPWRMALPATLRWIDADLPAILSYKTNTLATERPVCLYEPVAIDLQDGAARRALFERIGSASRKALVLTEGLLVYLTADDVGALAADLHRPASFQRWVIDLMAPRLLKMLQRRWGGTLAAGNAPLRFAPSEGTDFFRGHGWREAEFRSTFDEGQRLGRTMRFAAFWRFLARFASRERREELRKMGGIVRLERI